MSDVRFRKILVTPSLGDGRTFKLHLETTEGVKCDGVLTVDKPTGWLAVAGWLIQECHCEVEVKLPNQPPMLIRQPVASVDIGRIKCEMTIRTTEAK